MELVFFEKPELVAVIYNNNFNTTLSNEHLGDIAFNSKFDLDNEMNASNWIYIFRDGDNHSDYVATMLIKYFYHPWAGATSTVMTTGYYYPEHIVNMLPANFQFSLNNEIPISDFLEYMLDSPDFITHLKEQTSFMELIADTDNLKNFTISLQSYDEPTYGMDANQLYWVSIVESGDSVYVCYMHPNFNLTGLYSVFCNTYVSVKENFIASSITVSPNPTTTNFTVSFELEKSCDIEIMLCDILGRELVQIYSGFATVGDFTETVNTKHLPKGIYFLKIKIDGNITVEKVVVE
jgi:hypothetical protein